MKDIVSIRRLPLLLPAVILAFAAFPAETPAEELVCGCSVSSLFGDKGEHLNAYSNMLSSVEAVRAVLKKTETAAEDVKRSLETIDAANLRIRNAAAAFKRAVDDVSDLRRNASRAYLEAGRENDLRAFRDALSAKRDALETQKTAMSALMTVLDDPRVVLEQSAREIVNGVEGFDNLRSDVRTIWGRHSAKPCVDRMHGEVTRMGTALENKKKEAKANEEAARDKLKAAESALRDAENLVKDANALPRQIAETMGLSGISDFESLEKRLEELSRRKVVVRFFDGRGSMTGRTETFEKEKIGQPALPEAPRPGAEFLGWRDRDVAVGDDPAAGTFDFRKPVESDLDLVEVWTWEVTVRGVGTWRVPVEGYPTLRKVLESAEVRDFEKNHAAELAKTGEKQPDGWWKSGTDERVTSLTPVSGPLVIEPRDADVTFRVEWRDADGSMLAAPTTYRKGQTLQLHDLPRDTRGFHYEHWSDSMDGDAYSPKPVEHDLTLYAVRVADATVTFVDADRNRLGDPEGYRNGATFEPHRAPKAPDVDGRKFVGWGRPGRERDLFSGAVSEDVVLEAKYRDLSVSEKIDLAFGDVRRKVPLAAVIVADAVLLVLFAVLFGTGLRKPRKPHTENSKDPEVPETAEAPEPPSAPSAAAPLAIAALLLAPGLAAAADVAAGSVSPFDVPPFDRTALVYPGLLLFGAVLAVADGWILVRRLVCGAARVLSGFTSLFSRRPGSTGGGKGGGESSVPEEEFCPTCGEKLVDGECPQGHTIVRCSKCQSIMKDGVCPHCGVGGETEFCPTCNSELVDGECPRGHTIVRCPDCGSILQEGVCPRGCNADPLNIGWPGGAERKLGPFALKVVACPKAEGSGFVLRVPDAFLVGRSSTDAKEPFVELLTVTRKEKAQCSRQYVRFVRDGDGLSFTVTLVNSSRNPAFVENRKLVQKDETATLPLGGRIKLNPGYELELVEAPAEG